MTYHLLECESFNTSCPPFSRARTMRPPPQSPSRRLKVQTEHLAPTLLLLTWDLGLTGVNPRCGLVYKLISLVVRSPTAVSVTCLNNRNDQGIPSPDLILNTLAWCTVDPDKPSYFHNISINYGDEVSLTVIAGGKLGTAVIENHTTGEKVGETLTSRDDICRNGVNWMVELWGGFDNSANPFADFDTVTFSGAMASTSHGKSGLSNATEYTLTSSAEYKNLTTVLITDTNVIVQYKGN